MVTAMHASKVTAERGTEPMAYTLQEVARLLSLSYRKVRYMADDGELPVVRFGKARRVLASTLEDYVRELEQAQQRERAAS